MRRPMRMAAPDIVLLVVGALLFGGATFAIAKQPGGLTGATSAAGFFDVTYSLSEAEIGSEAVSNFRTGSVTFDVTQQNVTRLTFAVTCTDPAGATIPYNLQLTLTPPAGIPVPKPVSGACGNGITIEIPITDAPSGATARGSTQIEATANLAPAANSTRAVGAWTVDYSGARRGGPATLPLPAGDPEGSISVTAETWAPRFAPVQR